MEGWEVTFISFWHDYFPVSLYLRQSQLVIRYYAIVRRDGRNRASRSKVATSPDLDCLILRGAAANFAASGVRECGLLMGVDGGT